MPMHMVGACGRCGLIYLASCSLPSDKRNLVQCLALNLPSINGSPICLKVLSRLSVALECEQHPFCKGDSPHASVRLVEGATVVQIRIRPPPRGRRAGQLRPSALDLWTQMQSAQSFTGFLRPRGFSRGIAMLVSKLPTKKPTGTTISLAHTDSLVAYPNDASVLTRLSLRISMVCNPPQL